MNSIVLINKNENWLVFSLSFTLVLFLFLTYSFRDNDTLFPLYLTVSIFIYSTLLTYLIYVSSKRNAEYQHHKALGPYVPSEMIDNEIRRIELFRGLGVERYSVMYTRKKKYAERLLDQINEAGYKPTINYIYKEDCFKYSLQNNNVLITGKSGSREMAICIIYLEIFE